MSKEAPKTPDQLEQEEKARRYEEVRLKKASELEKVIRFLLDTICVKQHQGILMGRQNCYYFRGVNFHLAVLQNAEHILKLIPSFVEEKQIIKLETMEDSIKLGQFMMICKNLVQVQGDPRMCGPNEKTPKYVTPVQKAFSEKGIYMVLENKEEEQKSQKMWLGLVVVVIIVLMCFRLWPMWLKKGIWYISFYLLVFLIGAAILRVILWGILYHFGLEFWLFPNYFVDSNDPRDSFLPVYSFEIRTDFGDIRSIFFRIISGSLIVYMGYQFCQDEKNMKDLEDLANNGLNDLFEYGLEFTTGLALSDGKDKKNSTEQEQQKSFSEKYRE
jgi:translocation protein SEC62